jgi:hypothetical protein
MEVMRETRRRGTGRRFVTVERMFGFCLGDILTCTKYFDNEVVRTGDDRQKFLSERKVPQNQ